MSFEDAPSEKLRVISGSGHEYMVGRDNSVLYTFIGSAAMYDHVYLYDDKSNGADTSSIVIFKELTVDKYEVVKRYIEKHSFRQVLNMPQPTEFDVDAFSICVQQAIDAGIEDLFDN